MIVYFKPRFLDLLGHSISFLKSNKAKFKQLFLGYNRFPDVCEGELV